LDDRVAHYAEGLDPEATRALWNSLRLRVEIPDHEGTPNALYSAYEILCLLLQEDRGENCRAFEQIGNALWTRSWEELLSAKPRDVTAPGGIEMQTQIDQLALDQPEVLTSLVETVTRRLMVTWRMESGRSRILLLFAQRRRDRCLRRAIEGLAEHVVSDVVREILAAWLIECDRFENAEHGALDVVLADLASRGRAGEAFYALHAMGQIDPRVPEDGRYAYVHLALFIRVLTDHDKQIPSMRLLTDSTFLERVARHSGGRAVLAAVGCGFLEVSKELGELASAVLWNADGHPPLPESVIEYLLHRERMEPGGMIEVDEATQDIRTIASETIYGQWPPSRLFEKAWGELISAELDRLLDEKAPPHEVATLRATFADHWIRETTESLRRRDNRVNLPEGPARANILRMFKEAGDALDRLNRLRPDDGTTLRKCMAIRDARLRATAELRDWLEARSAADRRAGTWESARDLLARTVQ
jgi:hypothetical protein